MKYSWLRDPLVRFLYEDDEILAVDKPYGFDAHTNESKAGQEELIQPGLIELIEKQLKASLHIVHRLDRTTTGVIVFAKTEAAAEKYRAFFRDRVAQKTYLFVTKAGISSGSSSKALPGQTLHCAEPILRNGSSLAAETQFELVRAAGVFELWRAFPKTGRNHQIRIHAARLGKPLLGDETYGGAKFPVLCLHNQKLRFPNQVTSESRAPRWFDDLNLLDDPSQVAALVNIERRERLYQRFGHSSDSRGGECYRLVHSQKDSRDQGLSLDRFGDRDVLSWYGEGEPFVYERLAKTLESPTLVRYMKQKRDSRWLGSHPQTTSKSWVAVEDGIKNKISLPGLGLYLDQRLQRRWVRENSRAKTVLNLFSYTCGFSVAAVVGGAAHVTSVDSNKNVLNWGRENFVLNGLDPDQQTFLCRDVMAYLQQAKASPLEAKFDLVICDPPNFSRGDKSLFKIEAEIDPLLMKSLSLGRQILFSTNSDAFFVDDLRQKIERLAPQAEITVIQPSFDFESPGEKRSLKSFLIQTETARSRGPLIKY